MIRNLKALGLALVAVLALGAVVASAASAQQGTLTSDGPVTLDITQTGVYGSGANALTGFGGKVECEKATYTGHKVKETPHKPLPNGAKEITVTPHYGLCTGLGGLPATVDMNGCDYEFDIKETTASPAHTYGITPTVHCPTGKHIQVTFWEKLAPHTEGTQRCTLTVTEQTDYTHHTLDINDTTNGTLDITGTVNTIEIHKKGPAIICNEATTKEGILHIDVTVKGTNAEAKPTDISLSHP